MKPPHLIADLLDAYAELIHTHPEASQQVARALSRTIRNELDRDAQREAIEREERIRTGRSPY